MCYASCLKPQVFPVALALSLAFGLWASGARAEEPGRAIADEVLEALSLGNLPNDDAEGFAAGLWQAARTLASGRYVVLVSSPSSISVKARLTPKRLVLRAEF